MSEDIKTSKPRYSEDELMARLKFVVGMCLAITLMGIVFVVLYSIIFVTQPLGAISPVDSKFFELIIPIATFLTGTLSGIMLAGNNKEAQMKALEAATARPTPTTPPMSPTPSSNKSYGMTSSFDSGFGDFSIPVRSEPGFGMSSFGAPVMSSKGKPGPAQEPHPVI
jgi:hypothetical protein